MMQFSPQANHVVLSSNTSEPILHSKPIDRFGAVFSTLLTLLGFTGLWISFFTFEKSASMIGFMCTILVILCIWISIPNLLMIVSVSRLMTTYGYATAAIVMAAISTSAASSCFVLFAILSSQCDGQCTSYNLMLIACGVLGISQIIVLVIAGNEFQRVPKKLQQVSSRVQYVTQEQPVNPFPYYYTPPMYNQAPSVVPISAPQAPISEFSITDSPEM